MKKPLACLAFIFTATLLPAPAFACSCLRADSAQAQIEQVDLVFEGQVINVAQEKDRRSFWTRVKYGLGMGGEPAVRRSVSTFQVFRMIKGDVRGDIAITHLPGEWSATCGADFPKGRPIIVLAYKSSEGGYSSSLCSQPQFPKEDFLSLAPSGSD